MSEETIRCPFCLDGVWYKRKDWKEPYGYPYTTPTISCEVCNGSKAILKSEVRNHPDKKQITEAERKRILTEMSTSRGSS